MKTIKHPSLLNLVQQLIERLPEVNSYTANRMDPTLVTIQKLNIGKHINVEAVSSWGTELTITIGRSTFVDIYVDNDGVYLRQPLNRIHIKYMRSLVKRFKVIEREVPCYDEQDYPFYS